LAEKGGGGGWKWSWVVRLFNIALLFSKSLPTILITASGLCADENYKNLLVWQSFTENSYTKVAAPRLGCFTSIQNAPQTWKYQVPSFFKLNAVSHVIVTCIFLLHWTDLYILSQLHNMNEFWPLILTPCNRAALQSTQSYLVGTTILSYRCKVARA
jgi:hypothetical protein